MSDAAVTSTPAWVCPNCNREVCTAFCAQCGERPLRKQDLTLRGVFDRLLHLLTSIDGRLIKTVGRLVRRPGSLSAAYLEGARKPHTPPFQIFLVANVVFFATQSLTGINIFGSSLDSHLHHQDWSALAQSLLAARLEASHRSLAEYSPIFDRAVILNAKALVILMVLPFSLLLPLFFLRSRKPFMGHLVFSAHFYAFLLLVFSVAVLAAGAQVLLGGAGLNSPTVDNVLSVVNVVLAAGYLHVASGAFYGGSAAARGVKALLLTIGAAAIVVGYRFLLFLITLYST